MKSWWNALLIQILCLSRIDWHDTFPFRSGWCKRCHQYISSDGHAFLDQNGDPL